MQKMRIELGRRIRELRKANQWSQEELGERANLHPTCVGGIERGERNVSFVNLCRLANAFNLTLSQFFDFPKTGPGKRDVSKARIISLLRKRSEDDLALFLDIIGAIDKWKSQAK